jgi:molybdate transport system substrate-binding protein
MIAHLPAPAPTMLDVLCAGALGEIVEELASDLGRSTGLQARLELTRSGLVRDRLLAGESTDVAVTTKAAMEQLIAAAKVIADSATTVAHSPIGIAVRAGASRPRIDSTAAFVHALCSARSIAYADPATGSPSGTYLAALLHRLGIAAELSSRLRPVGAEAGHPVIVGELVARGEAEIGIQQISEILPVTGVELLGPLPAELQHLTTFCAGVACTAAQPQAARRLIALLTSPAAAAVIRAGGMHPA